MARRIPIELSQEARLELDGFYRRTRDGVVKMRCLAIRWLKEGKKCEEVAQKLGVSRINNMAMEPTLPFGGASRAL